MAKFPIKAEGRTEMREAFFLKLLETSSTHRQKSREGFRKLNLTDGQPKILYILYIKDGHTQKELARLCKVRESTLTAMLGKMEKKGYIYKEKTIVSGGKRAFLIFLTEMGKEKGREIMDLVNRIDKTSLDGFSEQEIDIFYDMLGRVTENLNRILP